MCIRTQLAVKMFNDTKITLVYFMHPINCKLQVSNDINLLNSSHNKVGYFYWREGDDEGNFGKGNKRGE